MNTNIRTDVRPDPFRKTAIATGVLYLITHVTSITAVLLYGPVLNNPAYITGSGPDTQILAAAFLEVILALAIVGTGAMIYPFIKKQHEGIALGYLSLRVLEAGIIAVGILPLLAIVTLRQQHIGTAGVDLASLVALGQGLVSFHNWTFIFGPNLIYGTNTVLLAALLYKSRLVPRFIPILMLVAGPAVFFGGAVKMFGASPELSTLIDLAAIPALGWELSFAFWMIFKGFNRSPAASQPAAAILNERLNAA